MSAKMCQYTLTRHFAKSGQFFKCLSPLDLAVNIVVKSALKISNHPKRFVKMYCKIFDNFLVYLRPLARFSYTRYL